MLINIIGFGAAFLTTVAFVPQALKTWRTKSTKDISVWMFLLLFLGLVLWLLYGVLTYNLPIIVANITTLCLAGIILYYIIFPGKSIGIEHVALWVNDLESMKNFYTLNFNARAGEKYINRTKKFSSYFISFSNGTRLELMHQPERLSENISQNHIALSVGSKKEVDTLTTTLIKRGINQVSVPRTTGDGYYESVFKDPEGNIIEITI